MLVACEFSGVVREAFRAKGHNAWSCDILPSDDNSKFHIQDDVFNLYLDSRNWDMMIAHPPCTYISNMSNCRIKEPGRMKLRKEGMDFFMRLANCNIQKIALENPRGLPEREYRKADQIIHPYHFGHPVSKQTCLWLKNLPIIKHTNVIEPERKWDGKRWRTWVDTCKSHTGKYRSVTFQGIANAMADQWV